MDNKDKDIRKEIEELEKLINKVKKQNEEEKRKQIKKPKNTVVRINLAATYSSNFWINIVFSFLINFIVIFAVLKLFEFAIITNDIFIIYLVVIFTGFEETYRRYLLTKQVRVVLYTSGLIFTFLNILIFYFMDLVLFEETFSFVNYLYPVAFVVLFQAIRAVIKNLYIRLNHRSALKKIKRK